MRHRFAILPRYAVTILIFSATLLNAQVNLVPNPGFENLANCPNAGGLIINATPWSNPNNHSPDLFNACAGSNCTTTPFVCMPDNMFGSQWANGGVSYAGLFVGAGDNKREYIQCKLNRNLKAGDTIVVSFYVSLADNFSRGIDEIGAYFSNNSISGNNNLLNFTPQVTSPSNQFLTDTAGWTMVVDSFVPQGGERYIIIGNFNDEANTNFSSTGGNGQAYSYYYIDDVSVVSNSPLLQINGNTGICEGDSVTLTAMNNDSLSLWADSLNPGQIISTSPSIVVSPQSTRTYMLYDLYDTVSYTVDVFPKPKPELGTDTSLCQGEQLQLNAAYQGATYQWSTGSTDSSINVSQAGNYWVAVNANGCTSYDSIDVFVQNIPTVDLGRDTIICGFGQLQLNAGGSAGSYRWQDNSGGSTFTVNQTGTYWVEASNGRCRVYDSIEVEFVDVDIKLGKDSTICPGQSVFVQAGPADFNYQWSDGSSKNTRNLKNSGTYWVKASYGHCEDTDTIRITHYETESFDLGPDTLLCLGDSLKLQVETGGSTSDILWSNQSTNSEVIVTEPGLVWARVTNANCAVYDSIRVSPGSADCQCKLMIPNAFTPNNDGLNENFRIEADCPLSEFHLRIFNRWGSMIFESNDPNKTWGGFSFNEAVNTGTYTFLIIYRFDHQIESRKEHGIVNLIR